MSDCRAFFNLHGHSLNAQLLPELSSDTPLAEPRISSYSPPSRASWIAQLVKNLPAMQETLMRFLDWEDSPGEGIGYQSQYSWASLVTQLVKNPPAMQETWVQSLGWEDPLERGKATHSNIPAWRIPWTV